MLKSDYERIGGPETLLRSIAATMDRNRFDPLLAVIRRPDDELLATYPSCLRQTELPWKGIRNLLATARHAALIARSSNVAVVHSHDMRANAVAAAMQVFHRVPWIAHVHGWLGDTHRGRWRIYEALDHRIVHTADRILVGSTAAQMEVRSFGSKPVEVVANAVTIPDDAALHRVNIAAKRVEIGVPDNAIVLGMFGRLHPCKGHEFFLRALARLQHEQINVHGLIVGEGQIGTELRSLAAQLELADRVTFTGYVEDVIRYLAVMDVVAVPSIQDSLPLVALEAMAYARPVVASAIGDLPYAITDGVNGYIVPVGDSAALAARLRSLACDPEARRRTGAAGRQRIIEAFSADAMSRALEAQYASVIGTGVAANAS
jgi:glycosyltransferase involved in cell wall biosynthesis